MGVTGRSSWKESITRFTDFLQSDITALTKFDFKLFDLALGWPIQQKVKKKTVLQCKKIMFLFLSSKKVIIVFIPLLKVNYTILNY